MGDIAGKGKANISDEVKHREGGEGWGHKKKDGRGENEGETKQKRKER